MSLRLRVTALILGLFVAAGAGVVALVSRQITEIIQISFPAYVSVPVYVLILWGIGFALAATLVGWLAVGLILRPLDELSRTARELDVRQLSRRVEVRSGAAEFRELITAVNEMLDRLAEGYDGQARFAANASHELRTPLAVQRTLIEVAMDAPEAGPAVRYLGANLLATNARNERLIDGMLVLAECDQGLRVTVPVRVDVLAERVIEEHGQPATGLGLTVRPELAECTVRGDPVLLERLLANLVGNAIKYNVPAGTITVRVTPTEAGGAELAVANTGPEIPAELVPTLLEPFRRVGSERTGIAGGSGLGLSIVRSIVAAHDGALRVHAGDQGGLRVEVTLPPGT
jgi:signal transduction histidine kinase